MARIRKPQNIIPDDNSTNSISGNPETKEESLVMRGTKPKEVRRVNRAPYIMAEDNQPKVKVSRSYHDNMP